MSTPGTTEPAPAPAAGWQKFSTVPVTVTAIEWTGFNTAEIKAVTEDWFRAPSFEAGCESADAAVCDEKAGQFVPVLPGQWIAQLPSGRFRLLDAAELAAGYEPAPGGPDPVVVVTQTVMAGGIVLRWYRSEALARHFDAAILTVSAAGIQAGAHAFLHDIPAAWLTAAQAVRKALREGREDDALTVATHQKSGLFGGRLKEIGAPGEQEDDEES